MGSTLEESKDKSWRREVMMIEGWLHEMKRGVRRLIRFLLCASSFELLLRQQIAKQDLQFALLAAN
jgi:hypothetical protein